MLKLWNKKTIISRNSRGSRRFRSFALLRYTLSTDPNQRPVLVNTRDVSSNGASFISNSKIPVNSILEMEIYLPPLKNSITVIANVVRISKVKDNERYVVGVRFSAIDPAERSRINSYIEKLAGDVSMRPYLDRQAKYFRRQTF